MPHQLPPLPYDYNALEPYIDETTMHLHHDKHHQAYTDNLNAALAKHAELEKKSVEDVLRNINQVPEDIRTAVRNNGGGYVNHDMFWKIMAPKAGGPATGKIADAIQGTFGECSAFQDQFNDAGAKRFGSGWVWLVSNKGKLEIISTANQDSPFMDGLYPIMGNDVWEHAYYLKYQNRRAEYLKAWWNVVNWAEVNRRFDESVRAAGKAA